MLSPYVPRGQRNWNKLCGWNVRVNKERYIRGNISINNKASSELYHYKIFLFPKCTLYAPFKNICFFRLPGD